MTSRDHIKLATFFKAWLIFLLAVTIGGAILGAVAGGILGFILGILGQDIDTIVRICGWAGYVVGVVLSFFAFRWVVRRYIIEKVIPPPLPAQYPQSY